MKKLGLLIPILLMLIFTACNGPKKLTRKGNSLSEAGIHKEAIEFYMRALHKDRAHVDAIKGLRKSGSVVLNNLQSDFFKAYGNSDYKTAVYFFLDMEKLQTRLNKMNAELKIPLHYKEDYKVAKLKYLDERFEEANEMMAGENFIGAENVFKEITLIDPSYGGSDLTNLMEISKLEPPYRKGNAQLDLNKNRTAYYAFKKVVNLNPNYKDAKIKMVEALELAQYAIAVLKFKNFSYERGAEVRISSIVIDQLIKNKGPFLKVLDRSSMDKIINEQYLSMNGWVSGNGAVETGELLGAKAILSGKIISVSRTSRAPKPTIVKAYKKRVVKTYNKGTDSYTTKTLYDKVSYKNYRGYNNVRIVFQFMLVSAETGEVLLSDVAEKNIRSAVDYSLYGGNYKDLVPGYWEYTWKKASSDKVDRSRSGVRDLRSKFTNSKSLKTMSSLTSEAFDIVGKTAAKKIYLFNPE